MKIYIVDNTRKMKQIKKEFEDYNIEIKENAKFKMTKNDYVILSDEEGTLDGIENLKNIFVLVKDKNYKYIWKLANAYKTIDIIDGNLDAIYIAERIKTKM